MRALALLDLFITVLLLAVFFHADVPKIIIVVFSLCLIAKAIIFLPDIASVFDIVIGILLILSIFIILPKIVLLLAIGFMGLKGLMSLFIR